MVATLFVCLQMIKRRSSSPLRSMGRLLLFLCLPLMAACGDEGTSQLNDLTMARGNQGRQNVSGSTINVSPTTFAFSVTQGDANPVHMISISNSGKGQLNWSVSTSASWLTVSPSTGTVSGNGSDTVMATTDFSGLAPGSYTAIITVLGIGATNNRQDISVGLTIAAPTALTSPSATTLTSSTSSSMTATSTTTASLSGTTTASAGLTWSLESDPSIIGYYVHYGMQSPNAVGSCNYEQSIYYSLSSLDSALPLATIGRLNTGTTYYFAVSAYNGTEGPCSTEVSKET